MSNDRWQRAKRLRAHGGWGKNNGLCFIARVLAQKWINGNRCITKTSTTWSIKWIESNLRLWRNGLETEEDQLCNGLARTMVNKMQRTRNGNDRRNQNSWLTYCRCTKTTPKEKCEVYAKGMQRGRDEDDGGRVSRMQTYSLAKDNGRRDNIDAWCNSFKLEG